jgi:hypothetical protein
MAAQELETPASRIILPFVVPRHYPDFSPRFYSDLRGTEDMTSRVKRHRYFSKVDLVTVFEWLNMRGWSNSHAKQTDSFPGGQILSAAAFGMIRVAVSNYRAIDRPPRIYEKIPSRAVETGFSVA